MKNFIFTLTAVIIVFGVMAPPAQAVWHPLLNEHFNRDQQNQNNLWPWITDRRNRIGWHANPWPPHWRHHGERHGDPTYYCWGVQDFIFSTHITPHDEINQSIWCAYTNRNLLDQPRWPEDDDYENLQNAWTWWGPFDLEEAAAAAVTYWVYIDLDNFSYDSLTVVITDNPGHITLNGDDFHENVPWGASYAFSPGEDWSFRIIYLDELIVGDAPDEDEEEDYEYTSVIGSDEVYLAFVWQSNRYGITGMGAFIDDVIISWDDGLFEISPLRPQFGFPEPEEDTIFWDEEWPTVDDEIYFRLPYTARGVGEMPEFDISLYLDDELIYTESMSLEGDPEVRLVTADTLWAVTEGDHVIRWELDTPVDDGGNVEEANENNNVIEIGFTVQYNPPPVMTLSAAEAETVLVIFNDPFIFDWLIEDEAPDDRFRVFMYWTGDTTGLAEADDPINFISDEYNFFWRDFDIGLGEDSFEWYPVNRDGRGYEEIIPVLPEDSLFQVVAYISDGFPGNYDVTVSPSWYHWRREGEVSVPGSPDGEIPTEFGIATAFPNPFNQTLKVEYTLNQTSDITLSIYDMSGRFVTDLASGLTSAGRHSIAWNPGSSPAGVYLIRLKSADQSAFKKVVYMP